MVREEGRENGVGIWELDDYLRIRDRITTRLEREEPEFILENIYVIGSYGAGYGVPGKSDLDIILEGYFNAALSSSERKILDEQVIDSILDETLIEGFPEISSVEIFIEDPSTVNEALQQYCAYEPVEYYYNLTTDSKETY